MASLTVVAGAGGFIGGHLVARLLREGRPVRAVDLKPVSEWFQDNPGAENMVADLRNDTSCESALRGASEVFNLAADMGGMGFIEKNRARCMLSVLINTQLLRAANKHGVKRYHFASSACVYPVHLQQDARQGGLKEHEAFPAMPEEGYGWEKLFSERMCINFRDDFALETRIARYHNVYGPLGAWCGGREKAPAAICRKVAQAAVTARKEIEIWGDGQQKRSFLYIDDCIEGTVRLMASDVTEPVNVGSDEVVSIDDLVTVVEDIAGVRLRRRYLPEAPVGVRARGSDNALVRKRLGWVPSTTLRVGLEKTYAWIYERVLTSRRDRVEALL